MVKIDIDKLKSLDVLKSRPKLTASDAASNDYFGSSVAFSNNGLLAIGAFLDDDNGDGNGTGSVYLFSGSGTNWTQQTKLTASDAASDDYFGISVAFSKDGSVLAIGAFLDDDNGDGNRTGSVYLFSGSGTNWTQQTKLTASDAASDDYFGSSVAFSKDGSVLAIGAYLDDDTGQDGSGSVYLFSGSGTNWTEIKKLTASDAATGDNFGSSVAFSNNGLLAIGAHQDDSGSVYLFSGSGTNWTQQTKLTASDADTSDYFGRSVAFNKNGLLAIGADLDNDNGQNGSGSVYLFSGSGTNWTEIKKLTASDAASNDRFGRSVAFSNNGLLAVGAYGDGSTSGSVYLYDLPLVKNKTTTKKKSLIQLSDSEVNDYANETHYNGTTILGIVKTENANGDKINYLVLDNDPNNVYGQLLKIKNDNTISRTEKIAIYKNYQGIYGFSPEINNYIESLLKN